jgi:hypothetical protein
MTIKCVSDIVEHNQFGQANVDDPNKPFVFRTEKNIGSGSNEDHLRICMTSLNLLKTLDTSNQGHCGIFHIDGTHKIIRNKFPLVVFDRDDITRQLFPIVFMLTSHEDETDFTYFYIQPQSFLRLLSTCHNIQVYHAITMRKKCSYKIYIKILFRYHSQ